LEAPLSDLIPLAVEMRRFAVADFASTSDRDRHTGVAFFTSRDSTLALWCAVLRLDVDAVRGAVQAQIAAPPNAPRRKAPHRMSRHGPHLAAERLTAGVLL
jgi:hypothetical protein